MAITNGYLTRQQFKDRFADQLSAAKYDDEIDVWIESASRMIDQHCGRRFWADGAATARTFYPATSRLVHIDDVHTTTGLVVKKDTSDDGTFDTTISSSDYQLEPLNGIEAGIEGWPYTRIRLVEAVTFPTSAKRPAVEVTADWGWAAVPKAIEKACEIITAHFFVMKDAPHGVIGFGDTGGVARTPSMPVQAMRLLDPYRKADHAVNVIA